MTLLLLLVGCGNGAWTVTVWGEDYIESGLPADVFADDCSVSYDTFNVVISGVALLDGDGAAVKGSELPEARVYDLVAPGPHPIASFDVPATHYASARYVLAPATAAVAGNTDDSTVSGMAGQSVHAAGTLSCGGQDRSFDWAFDTSTTYGCEPNDLTIPAGGQDGTELTIHGDHLFYDGLEAEDAEVRGQAIFDADLDGDGDVTLDELDVVPVAPLGYTVGQYAEVTGLGDFVRFLTRTLGHVDGEGHCQVDL